MDIKPGPGRPPGLVLHTEAFEALVALARWTKRDLAIAAGIEPTTLSDLIAHRCGTTLPKATRLAGALGVPTSAIFPELARWVAPQVVRKQKRQRPKAGAAA